VVSFLLVVFFSIYILLLLYVFLEIRLIPTFLIVLYWGNNWEWLEASLYLLIYIFISLPLLIYIIILYRKNFNLDMNLMIFIKNKGLFRLGEWDFLILFGHFLLNCQCIYFIFGYLKLMLKSQFMGLLAQFMLLTVILLKLGGLIRLRRMFRQNELVETGNSAILRSSARLKRWSTTSWLS